MPGASLGRTTSLIFYSGQTASLCFNHFAAALIQVSAVAAPLQQLAHRGDALGQRIQFGKFLRSNALPALGRPAEIVEEPSGFFERETAVPGALQDGETAEHRRIVAPLSTAADGLGKQTYLFVEADCGGPQTGLLCDLADSEKLPHDGNIL